MNKGSTATKMVSLNGMSVHVFVSVDVHLTACVLLTMRLSRCLHRCSRYPPVMSDSERHRYKADFTSEYSEYLRLHDNISQRMKTFSALSEKLKQAAQHSSEYEVHSGGMVAVLHA